MTKIYISHMIMRVFYNDVHIKDGIIIYIGIYT